MIAQTVMDSLVNNAIFRAVRNSTTKTSTVTITRGSPIVLETVTASADGVYARQALTSTAVDNNLFIGYAHASINPDSAGLVQAYGVDDDVAILTGGASVGAVLIPNVASSVTAGTTVTPGISTAAKAVVLVAPSGAAVVNGKVFVSAL